MRIRALLVGVQQSERERNERTRVSYECFSETELKLNRNKKQRHTESLSALTECVWNVWWPVTFQWVVNHVMYVFVKLLLRLAEKSRTRDQASSNSAKNNFVTWFTSFISDKAFFNIIPSPFLLFLLLLRGSFVYWIKLKFFSENFFMLQCIFYRLLILLICYIYNSKKHFTSETTEKYLLKW